MKEEWTVPENWALEVYQAIDLFSLETRISKKALAKALNINASSLSLSHLENSSKSRYLYQRLPYVFRGECLVPIGWRLQLDYEGFQALKRLAGRLLEISTGYRIGPVRILEEGREASAMGLMGVEHFGHEAWEMGAPYLQEAWAYFSDKNLFSEASLAPILFLIAESLMAWHSTNGASRAALEIADTLRPLARSFRGDDSKAIKARGLYYRAVGIAQRHAARHPDFAIQSFQKAQAILQDHPPADRMSDFRDQAKPYTFWGLKEPGKRAECFERAKRVLEEAEKLGGPTIESALIKKDWTLTRLAHIECLAAMQEEAQVSRLWDVTMGQDEIQNMLKGSEGSGLYAKWVFAEIAICFARQDLAAMRRLAKVFAADPRNARHGERVLRAKNIVSLVEQGNIEALRLVLVR